MQLLLLLLFCFLSLSVSLSLSLSLSLCPLSQSSIHYLKLIIIIQHVQSHSILLSASTSKKHLEGLR